jgi:hypothetical protein
VASLFERLAKGRPAPDEAASKPPRSELEPAQKLLDWLQRWARPTISVREIHVYGPNSLRDRESAINSAEFLVKNGWLNPLKAHRHDRRVWEIVRKPIVGPTVATN